MNQNKSATENNIPEAKNTPNATNKTSTKTATTAAQITRILTVPPCMVLALILTLQFTAGNFFETPQNLAVAIAGFVVLPILAYPLQKLVPKWRSGGREKQRKLAFVSSLIGYFLAFLYRFTLTTGRLRVFFGVYFYTVVLLTVCNKVLHIRASGHGASAISPAVLSGLYGGILPCAIFSVVFLISAWASVYLKRHKISDIVCGVAVFGVSLGLAVVL